MSLGDRLRQEGKRVGRAEGRAEAAIRMIRRDLDDDLIEEITELSADKIKRLRTTYNGGRG